VFETRFSRPTGSGEVPSLQSDLPRAVASSSDRRDGNDTRGPAGNSTAPTRCGPLSSGPLGPLGTGPRIDLEPLVEPLKRHWGAEPGSGRFPCPIPGHTGYSLLGPDLNDPTAEIRLHCCKGRTRPLGEVRAAQSYGTDVRLTNISAATWLRRLAFEHGCFQPLHVELPNLPEEVPSYVRVAARGFALLVGLRWADYDHRPVAFSTRFCAVWCGLTLGQARKAITALEEAKAIRHEGSVGRARLFAPGTGYRLRRTLSEEELIERLRSEFDAVEVFEEAAGDD
jgi:hypothetical protein